MRWVNHYVGRGMVSVVIFVIRTTTTFILVFNLLSLWSQIIRVIQGLVVWRLILILFNTAVPTFAFKGTVPCPLLGPEAVDYGEGPKIISDKTFDNCVKVVKPDWNSFKFAFTSPFCEIDSLRVAISIKTN